MFLQIDVFTSLCRSVFCKKRLYFGYKNKNEAAYAAARKGKETKMNTDKIYAEAIANEYSVKDTSKVVALKKLDRNAKRPANIFAYTFGTIMTLVFGTGMCLAMKVIGGGSALMTGVGIGVGVLGMAGVAVNYPIYKKLLNNGKKKYGSDIVRLAKEIADENK